MMPNLSTLSSDDAPAASWMAARRQVLLAMGMAGIAPSILAEGALAKIPYELAVPLAPLGPTARFVHGVSLRDPYGWIDAASLADPRIVNYLAANQRYSDAVMAPLAPLISNLRRESQLATPIGLTPVPVADGAFEYWLDWSKGHRRLMRRSRTLKNTETLLGSEDTGDRDGATRDFVAWGMAPGANIIAFAIVETPEHHLIQFKDLTTGRYLPDRLINTGVQITSERIVWTADGAAIVYGEVDDAGRPWRARLHRLGTPQAADRLLHQEDDPAFFVEIRQTTSGNFILINSVSIDSSEVRLLNREMPGEPQVVSQRKAGRLYTIDEAEGELAILTNDTNPNFRLVSASLANTDRWTEIIPASPRVGLTWHIAFKRHVIVSERFEGSSRVRVLNRKGGEIRTIEFPEVICAAGFDRWTAGPEANRTADPDMLRLGIESFNQPKALYDYRFDDGALLPLQSVKRSERRYEVERLVAIANDGVRIPMSVVKPRSGRLRGAILYGYGAYGVPSDPDFDPQRLSMLDRGVAYVIAHVRGGGDLGGSWHEAGRRANRGRPIEDFLSCAKSLVAMGFVERGKIACVGRSAGGWLIAAAVNRDPGLWAAMVADVPFVDVLTQLLKAGDPMGAAEISETGNVIADSMAFQRAIRLCPYRNISVDKFPSVHLTASLADLRVPWTGPLKYAARLRAATGSKVVLRFDRGGNHWGPSDPEIQANWRAERAAFTLDALQIGQ